MHRRRRTPWSTFCLLLAMCLATLVGCAHYEEHRFIVTAYSPEETRYGRTASGTTPKKGTLAADPRYYPYGTVMHVPGYGKGVVEDTGGAIQGPDRLDVFFPRLRQALRWGRQILLVKIKR